MRIRRLSIAASALALCLCLVPAAAHAQGSDGTGIGVGVQSMLTSIDGGNLTGPALVYQTPQFHIDGILTFDSDDATAIGIGGRFFWELHSTQASDLSLGGGVGFFNVDGEGDNDSSTDIHLELGAKIRAFLAPSFAVSASVGLGFLLADEADIVVLGGQLIGGVGLTYFFF